MEREPQNADEIRESLGLPKMPSLEEWLKDRESNLRRPVDPAVLDDPPEFPPSEKDILDDEILNNMYSVDDN